MKKLRSKAHKLINRKIPRGEENLQNDQSSNRQHPEAAPAGAQDETAQDVSASEFTRSARVTLRNTMIWQKSVENVQRSPEWGLLLTTLSPGGNNINAQVTSANVTSGAISNDTRLVTPQRITDIQIKLEKLQQHEDTTSTFRKTREKAFSVLGTINAAGTAVAALNPYASLAWSLLQSMLSMAQNYQAVRQLCWESIPLIASLIDKYQLHEQIYTNTGGSTTLQPSLDNALERLYTALLSYQVFLVSYLGSSAEKFKSLFVQQTGSKVQIKLDEIRALEKIVAEQELLVTGELTVSMYDRVSDLAVRLKDLLVLYEENSQKVDLKLQLILTFVNSKERNKILKWISPIHYETSHTRFNDIVQSETTDWLLRLPEYQTWRGTNGHTGFWLVGFMGSGKSCLSHAVIKDLKTFTSILKPNSALAYFYCDGLIRSDSNQSMLGAENILACFVKQLAESCGSEALPQHVVDIWNSQQNKAERLTKAESKKLLMELTALYPRTFFVIDGLDECATSTRENLLSSLQNISASNGSIKVFIASRYERDIKAMTNDWFDEPVDVAKHNAAAIDVMIESNVAAAKSTAKLKSLYCKTGRPDHAEDVIKVLKANAQGMFRWVQMALEYLHEDGAYADMTTRLSELGRLHHLFELYEAIYARIISNMTAAGKRRQRVLDTALTILLHGQGFFNRNEFTGKELVGACSFAATATLAEEYETSDIVNVCPSFLEIYDNAFINDRFTSYIRFPHFSVQEFLLDRHPDKFSECAGHAHLATLCMETFTKLELHQEKIPSFTSYAANYWLDHILLERSHRKRVVLDKNEGSGPLNLSYEQALRNFLPNALEQSSQFEKWHLFLIRHYHVEGLSRFVHTLSVTPLFAWILLFDNFPTVTRDVWSITGSKYIEKRPAVLALEEGDDISIFEFPAGESKPFSALSFAACWGRLHAVEWLLQSIEKGDMRSEACTEVISSFSDMDYTLGDWARQIDEKALAGVAECLLDNGARVTRIQIEELAEHSFSVHAKALLRVLRARGYSTVKQEDGAASYVLVSPRAQDKKQEARS